MKVLFVCEGFNRYSIRVQPWKHVFELARRMQNRGDEICVLTDIDANFRKNEVLHDVYVNRIKKGKFLFDNRELNKSLNGDFDVINWHASGPLSAMHFLRCKELKKNLVWTLHAGIIDFSDIQNLKLTELFMLRSFWNNILYSLKPEVFIKKAAYLSNLKIIITLSRRLKNRFMRAGVNKGKLRVIYSGVDTQLFSTRNRKFIEKAREKMGFQKDVPIILYYGPLTSFRGVDELLYAMPIVLSKFPYSIFVFLARSLKGDPKSNTLKKRIMKHRRAVLVEGVQSQKSLIRYLNIADIIALPFRFWPFVECPLTVLEAMAVGKPLVTTPIGAIPEIVKDGVTGLLVKPREKEIGAAITTLLKNEQLATRIAQNARRYVETYHSWDYITEQTRKAFQESLL